MAKKTSTKKITTKKHLAREHREAKQTRLLLIITGIVGALILGLLFYGIIDQTLIRPRTPIAQVGDTTITAREFESYVQYSRVQLLNQSFQLFTFYQQFGEFGASFLQNAQTIAMQLNQPIAFGRDILDEMIDNQIIRDEAAQRGLSVSQAEIDEAIQAAFGFFPDGTPTPTVTATIQPTPTLSETQLALITITPMPTDVEPVEEDIEEPPVQQEDNEEDVVIPEPEDLEDELAEFTDIDENLDLPGVDPELPVEPEATPTITLTPTPYTEELFNRNIRDFNSLYAPYNFDIDDLRDIFEVQLLREKLIEELSQDLSPVKSEVWARHILVASLEEALEVLSLLEQGEDFHTLAETYSLDESNREQGGNLGWFDENTMVMEFSEVAFSLAEGEISDPVETTFGFHIIQSLGKRESQIPPAEFRTQQENVFIEWLTEQRNTRDDIEVFDAWDKHVPTTPEVPQQFLFELFQQQP
jgi:peptidyl-prolyl cis-trans isomerase D